MNYTPRDISYNETLPIAEKVCKQLGAKKMINLRIARGGCFVARFYAGTKKINGVEVDVMYEAKLYDNLKED